MKNGFKITYSAIGNGFLRLGPTYVSNGHWIVLKPYLLNPEFFETVELAEAIFPKSRVESRTTSYETVVKAAEAKPLVRIYYSTDDELAAFNESYLDFLQKPMALLATSTLDVAEDPEKRFGIMPVRLGAIKGLEIRVKEKAT